MSDFETRTISSFIKKLIPVITLAIFTAPTAAGAELLLQLNDARGIPPTPETSRQTVKLPEAICLNESGDLVVRHSDVSLTVTYLPHNEVIEPPGRLRIVQRLDYPSISGISLKFSFLF